MAFVRILGCVAGSSEKFSCSRIHPANGFFSDFAFSCSSSGNFFGFAEYTVRTDFLDLPELGENYFLGGGDFFFGLFCIVQSVGLCHRLQSGQRIFPGGIGDASVFWVDLVGVFLGDRFDFFLVFLVMVFDVVGFWVFRQGVSAVFFCVCGVWCVLRVFSFFGFFSWCG